MQQYDRLKVLQIYASKGWGGGERYVLDLSNTLFSHGCDVISVSKKCPVISSKVTSMGNYYQLPMRGAFDIYSGIALARIIKREKPDIIHAHNFKDAFVAIYAKIISRGSVKVIVSRHLVKRSKKNFLYNWLYRKIDKLIFVSQLAKEEFLSSDISIDRDKITVVYNSTKTDIIDVKEDIRETYKIDKSSIILAFSGRVVPEKGLDVLLEALSLLRNFDFKLLVLGKGSKEYINELNNKAAELMIGDKIIMLGFVDNVRSVISQVDVGVVPSVVRESFGLSVIEFMSLGKVVVTTNNGAQPEFINDEENGYLVPPSDAHAIANRLKVIFENEVLRREVGENAARYFKDKLSYDKFFENIYAIYKTVS